MAIKVRQGKPRFRWGKRRQKARACLVVKGWKVCPFTRVPGGNVFGPRRTTADAARGSSLHWIDAKGAIAWSPDAERVVPDAVKRFVRQHSIQELRAKTFRRR